MQRRHLLGLAATLVMPAVARAQSGAWPSRGSIRLVAQFPPGGLVDTISRLIAPPMAAALGQTVLVENRAGAGGVIGTDFVAKSPADGYTFLVSHASVQVFSTATLPSLPFDPIGDFTHMGEVGTGQATKLVNQTIVLTNYCVLAEALRLAEAYGVDVGKIPQALAPGHAGSNLLPVAFPRMAAADFAPRGYARQVLKDLEMLQAAAADEHVAMPMAAQALTLYRLLVASGHSERDAGAVVTLYPKTIE